jgi:hypothetical protein
MTARKWSQAVTEHSDALDLERDVFTLDEPGRAQQASQGHAISIGDVDADLLHQPRRRQPASQAAANIGSGERGIAEGVRQKREPMRIAENKFKNKACSASRNDSHSACQSI